MYGPVSLGASIWVGLICRLDSQTSPKHAKIVDENVWVGGRHSEIKSNFTTGYKKVGSECRVCMFETYIIRLRLQQCDFLSRTTLKSFVYPRLLQTVYGIWDWLQFQLLCINAKWPILELFQILLQRPANTEKYHTQQMKTRWLMVIFEELWCTIQIFVCIYMNVCLVKICQ